MQRHSGPVPFAVRRRWLVLDWAGGGLLEGE